MNWEQITTALGEMAILVSAVAWLSKAVIKVLLAKDLENFKATLQIESQKRVVEFSSLHARRAELISELYSKVVSLERGIFALARELGHREFRVEEYKREQARKPEPWRLEIGVHTLTPSEESKARALQDDSRSFFDFYNEKKIYFSPEICQLIDSFVSLAGYMALMYQNVAIKDDNGESLVDPLVAQFWVKAAEQLPKAKESLENEFRNLLGVTGGSA